MVLFQHRIQALLWACKEDLHVTHQLTEVLSTVQSHADMTSTTVGWSSVRRALLDFWCPVDWLAQIFKLWRQSMVQGPQPVKAYLHNFSFWLNVVNHLLPHGQAAMQGPFQALLLRAGVNKCVEVELQRRNFSIFDKHEVYREILASGILLGEREGADPPTRAAEVRLASALSTSGAEQLPRCARDPQAVLKILHAHDDMLARCKRLRYDGALAALLQAKGVSEQDFRERMQRKVCVYCGSSHHMLYTCPEYQQYGLHTVHQQGQQRLEHSRARWRSKEQRLHEQWQAHKAPGPTDHAPVDVPAGEDPARNGWVNPTQRQRQKDFRREMAFHKGQDPAGIVKAIRSASPDELPLYVRAIDAARAASQVAAQQARSRGFAPSIPTKSQGPELDSDGGSSLSNSLSGQGHYSSDEEDFEGPLN